jgi:hypothetical protein
MRGKMIRILFLSLIMLACITGCKKETSVEPFNYERDTPAWLKEKIDVMSQNKDYIGTKVFRYDWKGSAIYYCRNITFSRQPVQNEILLDNRTLNCYFTD